MGSILSWEEEINEGNEKLTNPQPTRSDNSNWRKDSEAEGGQHLIYLLFQLFWIGLIVDLIKNGVGGKNGTRVAEEEEEEVRRRERESECGGLD